MLTNLSVHLPLQVKRAKLEAASATAFQDATRTGFAARRMLEVRSR